MQGNRQARRSMSRVTTACSSCRTRRSKCDGARPRCGNCARLDLGCEYSLIDGRKSRHTEGEVKALRDRIRHLEQQLEDSTAVVDRLVRAAVPRDNWWSGESHLAALEQGAGEADGAGTQQSFDELGQVGFLAGSLPGNWELDLPDGDDVLAQASPSQSSEATSAGSVIDTLSAVLGKLRFDQESGEPYYLGPTSSLHLPRLNPRLGRPHTAQLAQFQLYFPPPELPGHLRDIYRTTVHRHLPMVQLAKLDGVKDTSEFAINPDLLTTQILALASWFLQPDDPWYSHREACMDYYQNSFTVTVGYEMDRVSLANAQAFVLRAYMGILQGSLDAANIFLGVACNMTKRLGLHIDPASIDGTSKGVDWGEQTATFWACYRLDRNLAMMLGRACHMTWIDVSLPRPLGLIPPETLHSQRLSTELVYACHIEHAHLQDLCFARLYSIEKPTSTRNAISEGHARLMTWHSQLPLSIKDIKSGHNFDPSFVSLHMCFHASLILIHRASLKDNGKDRELANNQCRTSAGAVTSLLRTYQRDFGDRPVLDPMIVHAALTASVIHLVELQNPDPSAYRKAVRALRLTVNILASMAPSCAYAKIAHDDLRQLATEWEASPACSASFWPLE